MFPATRKVDLVTRESKEGDSRRFQAVPNCLELLRIAWNGLELCGVMVFASKDIVCPLQI